MRVEHGRDQVLQVDKLTKQYQQKTAVAGLSLSVGRGEIVGLLGANGAGKTSTINMILGVLAPTSGQISICGMDLAKQRSAALTRTNFAAVYAPMPGNLTVAQNLRIFAMMYGVKAVSARIDEVLAAYDLVHYRNTKCGVLSSGEQSRVCVAKAMLNRPELLLLDEPTASLDPATARDIRGKIQAFAAQDGGGVLWTSHNMYEVEAVCNRVLFMARGKILLEGDPRTLAAAHGQPSLEELFIKVASDSNTAEEH